MLCCLRTTIVSLPLVLAVGCDDLPPDDLPPDELQADDTPTFDLLPPDDVDTETESPNLPADADELTTDPDPQGGYWGGWQPIIQVKSGLCLDASGETPGTFVRQHWCHFSQRQQWKFLIQFDGSYFRVQNQRSGLCLDTVNGWLTLEHCGNWTTQRFVVHDPSTPGLVQFENLADHECWDIPNGWIDPTWVNGSFQCQNTTNQQWVVVVPENSYACGV